MSSSAEFSFWTESVSWWIWWGILLNFVIFQLHLANLFNNPYVTAHIIRHGLVSRFAISRYFHVNWLLLELRSSVFFFKLFRLITTDRLRCSVHCLFDSSWILSLFPCLLFNKILLVADTRESSEYLRSTIQWFQSFVWTLLSTFRLRFPFYLNMRNPSLMQSFLFHCNRTCLQPIIAISILRAFWHLLLVY